MIVNRSVLKKKLVTNGSHLRQLSREMKTIDERIKKLEFIIKREQELYNKKSSVYVLYERERKILEETLKSIGEKEKIHG